MLGALIGGVGSILGGLFGASGAEAGAKSAVRGARINAAAARWASKQNLKYQQKFARQGIRWRVRDAKLAGIHPLAALGAQTTAFSPSFVGGSPGDGLIEAGRMRAEAANSFGQSIGRAAQSFGDIDDRNNAYLAQMQSLQLKNAELSNAVLASQVANLNQPGNPPASPTNRWLVDGQGQTTLSKTPAFVKDRPLQRVVSDPARPWSEPAAVTDTGYTRTNSGYAPVMSTDAKERLEEDTIGGLTWNLRNRVLQSLQFDLKPPYAAPRGKTWWYSPLRQQYELVDAETRPDQLPAGGYKYGKPEKIDWADTFGRR